MQPHRRFGFPKAWFKLSYNCIWSNSRLNYWFIKPLFSVENQVEESYLSSSERFKQFFISKKIFKLQTKQISAARLYPPPPKKKPSDVITNIPTALRACILMLIGAPDIHLMEDSFINFPRPVKIVIFCPPGRYL